MTLFANGFDMDEIGTPKPISYPPLVFVKGKPGCLRESRRRREPLENPRVKLLKKWKSGKFTFRGRSNGHMLG
jgi:hypothetical protein